MKETIHLFTYHCLWFFFGTTPVCTTPPIPGGANIPFAFRLAAWLPSAPVLCIADVKNSFKLHQCPLSHAVHKLWCWQPLQKQLNPVKYLEGFGGLLFFYSNAEKFSGFWYSPWFCGLQIRAFCAFPLSGLFSQSVSG